MPDYFSHSIVAEVVYERLPAKKRAAIADKTLYLLGAQGGDIFFAYNLTPSKSNLGREMHRLVPEEVFEKLVAGNISYAAGFATHYALDCTLHSAVYAYEYTHRSPFAHIDFENDLGLYISRHFKIRRKILPRDKILACTFPVYDSLKPIKESVTVTGVERCLKRHFRYTQYIYRGKRQKYKCDFDFPSLSQSVDEAVALAIKCVDAVLCGKAESELFTKPFLNGRKN